MINRLIRISQIQASLRTRSDLHISSSEREFQVRTIQQTTKHQDTALPYIPGSTLKGVMRSQLELILGLSRLSNGGPLKLKDANDANWPPGALAVLQLFGCQAYRVNGMYATLGPSRCAFHHAELRRDWIDDRRRRGLPMTNWTKLIRTNRTSGEADKRADLEVVPEGAIFDFRLVWREYEGDETSDILLRGLSHMVEHGIGFGVSRGLGRIALDNVTLDGLAIELPNIFSSPLSVDV